KQFNSEQDFENFVQEYNTGSNYYPIYYQSGMMMDVATKSAGATSPTMASSEQSAKLESVVYSETNNQVTGVDEADIIKTDGNYIYTITDQTLFIVKAYPGEDAKIVSTIKFKNNPQGLFIYENHIAVFGYFYDLDYFKQVDFRPRYGMTFFNIYDISEKENPELIKEYKFEGSYFQARMTDKYVYFVTTNGFDIRPNPLPLMFDGAEKIHLLINNVYYYDIPYKYPQFANIYSINLKDISDEVNFVSVIVEGSQNMYMSKDNIYITYTEYIDQYDLRNDIMMNLLDPMISNSDKTLIQKIKQADNDVLSSYEKKNKINSIYYDYYNYMSEKERSDIDEKIDEALLEKIGEYDGNFEFTVINKIKVKDGNINIDVNGKVPGHILNQFSMDEYDGVFRIATTINPSWYAIVSSKILDKISASEKTTSTSNVFTLDNNLKIMDKLVNIAPGEQIYSTRFIGDKLYMVTFRQVDPFFVIDLSNPNNIGELGELKIPGFSRYLHPYDENTIIGIGRDATLMGRTQGLKISLFDVSDVKNPREIANFVTDETYAHSTAEYEHKAFLFDKDKNLLVIPAYSYTYDWREGNGVNSLDYNGAFVFKITKDEIKLRGIIDHSKNADANNYYYQAMVERSLFIQDLLYTKSPNLLRINKIDDLQSVKNVELKQVTTSRIPIY
ncbi:MAG: beta-propeller domain-containing protein, partial [Candidatus Woesearchaeota archaeon]